MDRIKQCLEEIPTIMLAPYSCKNTIKNPILATINTAVHYKLKQGKPFKECLHTVTQQLIFEVNFAEQLKRYKWMLSLRCILGYFFIIISRQILYAFTPQNPAQHDYIYLGLAFAILTAVTLHLFHYSPQSWFLTIDKIPSRLGELWLNNVFGCETKTLNVISQEERKKGLFFAAQNNLYLDHDRHKKNTVSQTALNKAITQLPLWEFFGMGLSFLLAIFAPGKSLITQSQFFY